MGPGHGAAAYVLQGEAVESRVPGRGDALGGDGVDPAVPEGVPDRFARQILGQEGDHSALIAQAVASPAAHGVVRVAGGEDAGADAVKIESERCAVEKISYVVSKGIPVCAHIGYTPQTPWLKASIQGKDIRRATELVTLARQCAPA